MILKFILKTKIQFIKLAFIGYIGVIATIFPNEGGAMANNEPKIDSKYLRDIYCSSENSNAKIYLIDIKSVTVWPFIVVHNSKILTLGEYTVGNGSANYSWDPLSPWLLEKIPKEIKKQTFWKISDLPHLYGGTVLITKYGYRFVGMANDLRDAGYKNSQDFYAFFSVKNCGKKNVNNN